MKNIIILAVPLILLLCCKNGSEDSYPSLNVKEATENPTLRKESRDLTLPKAREQDLIDRSKSEQKAVVEDFRPKGLKTLSLSKKDVMGVWKGDYDDGPNATMAIYEDSLFNVEHAESYGYALSGDTLMVDFDDWKSISIVTKAVKNTLILMDENGETIYTMFKDGEQ